MTEMIIFFGVFVMVYAVAMFYVYGVLGASGWRGAHHPMKVTNHPVMVVTKRPDTKNPGDNDGADDKIRKVKFANG